MTTAHFYGHDFSRMHLRFQRTSVGANCHIANGRLTQILPGSHIPDGSVFYNVGRAVHFQGLATEPNRRWAGNPVSLQTAADTRPKFAECA